MYSHLRLPKNLLSLGLVCLIACEVMPPAALAQAIPARIELLVVEGEGAVHNVRQRAARNLVVKVEDDNQRPMAGVSVVFALPIAGPSGEFPNGSRNLIAVTDKDGMAVARGLKINQIPGKVQIYVTASYRGLRSNALITQFIEGEPIRANTPEIQSRKSSGKWKWIVLGVVAAGGAGAGVYFGKHTTSNPPISVSTGTVVFGSPL